MIKRRPQSLYRTHSKIGLSLSIIVVCVFSRCIKLIWQLKFRQIYYRHLGVHLLPWPGRKPSPSLSNEPQESYSTFSLMHTWSYVYIYFRIVQLVMGFRLHEILQVSAQPLKHLHDYNHHIYSNSIAKKGIRMRRTEKNSDLP